MFGRKIAKPPAPAKEKPPMSAKDAANPWINRNLTKQCEIYEANPELALKLATEAGKPVIAGGRVGVMPPPPPPK